MMSNGINKQQSQHWQCWEKANTNAADWAGTQKLGRKLLREAHSPRPKHKALLRRAGEGRERQQKTTSIKPRKSLELLTGSEKYWEEAWPHTGDCLRLLSFPFPSLFFHIKELIWSNTTVFSLFCPLEMLSFWAQGTGGRETPPCCPPNSAPHTPLC